MDLAIERQADVIVATDPDLLELEGEFAFRIVNPTAFHDLLTEFQYWPFPGQRNNLCTAAIIHSSHKRSVTPKNVAVPRGASEEVPPLGDPHARE